LEFDEDILMRYAARCLLALELHGVKERGCDGTARLIKLAV
jgi:hypothetical protein